MATVKALKDHHGSDGYKFKNQEWEVSDEEAKSLAEAGHIEIVVTPQADSSAKPKEEPKKASKPVVNKQKEEKATSVTKEEKETPVTKAE